MLFIILFVFLFSTISLFASSAAQRRRALEHARAPPRARDAAPHDLN